MLQFCYRGYFLSSDILTRNTGCGIIIIRGNKASGIQKPMEDIKMKKLEMAMDPNTSAEVLAVLAQDDDWRVRYEVARNPSTSAEGAKK